MELCEKEQSRSERLEAWSRALNYCKSKNLSLEVIVALLQCNSGRICDEIKTFMNYMVELSFCCASRIA